MVDYLYDPGYIKNNRKEVLSLKFGHQEAKIDYDVSEGLVTVLVQTVDPRLLSLIRKQTAHSDASNQQKKF